MQPRWLRRWSSAQRKALLVTVISCLGWSIWNGCRIYEHPWADLSRGKYTDHFSHMNAARIFPRMGLDIWRVPINQKFRALTLDELAAAPLDVQVGGSMTGGVFYVPGWPKDKPLTISWSQKTRMYPPGDMLLVAPIALAYHYTSLTLKGACRLLIAWFTILTHAALFFFALNFFESKARGLDWLVAFLVYSHVMYWTLEGFYDAAAIVPLVISTRYMARRRGVAGLTSYCVATFIHFRAFFQAPYAVAAVGQMFRYGFWRDLRARHYVAIAIALLLGCTSLYVFRLDWSSLRDVLINNPLRSAASPHEKAQVWNLKVVLLVCGVAFLWSRAWLDLVELAWLGLIAFKLREFYYWHMVVSTAWVAAPAKTPVVRAVRLAFLMTLIAIVFRDPFVPEWLWMINETK